MLKNGIVRLNLCELRGCRLLVVIKLLFYLILCKFHFLLSSLIFEILGYLVRNMETVD